MKTATSASSVPPTLASRLLATAAAASIGTGVGLGVGVQLSAPTASMRETSAEVLLAMEIGNHYEGLRLVPYQDTGGVWTVCRGITGAAVVRGKTYSMAECKRLELAHYQHLERRAPQLYRHWDSYNVWVRASMLDMLFNLGEGQVAASTHLLAANAGDLSTACQQMRRWVWGMDARTGRKVPLAGLAKRRASTAEICQHWGRDGHFSAQVPAPQPAPKPPNDPSGVQP